MGKPKDPVQYKNNDKLYINRTIKYKSVVTLKMSE